MSTVGSMYIYSVAHSFSCQVGDASGKRFEEYRKFLAKVYPKFMDDFTVGFVSSR